MVMLGFSPGDCARIANTVKRVERMPLNQPRHRRRNNSPSRRGGVAFHNGSGSTCPLGGLMEVNGSGTGSFPRCLITKPSTTFQRHYLINVGGDVDDGDEGRGEWISDGGRFLVAGGSSPGVGDCYGVTPGQWYATKNRYGFTVETTTTFADDGLVYGCQEFVSWLPGKADSQIAKGSTGPFSIWWRNSATGAWEDSGLNVTARALFAINPATPKGSSISYSSGEWLAGPWEC